MIEVPSRVDMFLDNSPAAYIGSKSQRWMEFDPAATRINNIEVTD